MNIFNMSKSLSGPAPGDVGGHSQVSYYLYKSGQVIIYYFCKVVCAITCWSHHDRSILMELRCP